MFWDANKVAKKEQLKWIAGGAGCSGIALIVSVYVMSKAFIQIDILI